MSGSEQPRLVVLGGLNLDLVALVERLPGPGETVLGGRFLQAPGGKGANQAVAAARLGARVAMVGKVGRDSFGRALRQSLRAAGVDTAWVRGSAEPTGVALIFVDRAGENTIAVAPGANHDLRAAELPAARLARADGLVTGVEVPLEAVHAALGAARAAGVPSVLNAATVEPLPKALLEAADVLVVNEHELAALLGQPGVPAGAEGEAAARLRVRPEQIVIVTLGQRGALALVEETVISQPSFPVEAVDTTAAGDAFVGAFALAWVSGASLAESLRDGCAAGALATTRPGAQPSLPTRAELLALLEQRRGPA
jgi:ribokinase